MNRRRLDFEALRDALLAVVGPARRQDGRHAGGHHDGRRSARGARCTASSTGRTCRACSAPSTSPAPTPRTPQRYHDHRAAAGAVPDEQPVRARAGPAPGRPAGRDGAEGRPASASAACTGCCTAGRRTPRRWRWAGSSCESAAAGREAAVAVGAVLPRCCCWPTSLCSSIEAACTSQGMRSSQAARETSPCDRAPAPDPPRPAAPLRHGLRRARPRRPAGAAGLLGAAVRRRVAAGPEAAALPRQGQARHPPVHERRAVARRYLRPQAGPGHATPASRCRTPTCAPSARPAPPSRRRSSSRSYGQSGIEVSELFPHVAECIDDICVIRSMHADVPNHEPSLMLMNCGEARLIRPSMGSWVTYGLGTREPEPARLHRHVPRRLSDPGDAELAGRRSCPASTRAPTSTRSTPTSKS